MTYILERIGTVVVEVTIRMEVTISQDIRTIVQMTITVAIVEVIVLIVGMIVGTHQSNDRGVTGEYESCWENFLFELCVTYIIVRSSSAHQMSWVFHNFLVF